MELMTGCSFPHSITRSTRLTGYSVLTYTPGISTLHRRAAKSMAIEIRSARGGLGVEIGNYYPSNTLG